MQAQKGHIGVAIPIDNIGARRGGGAGDFRRASAAFLPGRRPSAHCIEGWMDLRVGVDLGGIFRLHRGSNL
jgi:hypothetical protein